MIKNLIIVRGGGDLASGVIHRLYKEKKNILILESPIPTSIRRNVAFSEAIYEGRMEVSGVTAKKINSINEMSKVLVNGEIPIMVDPFGESIQILKPAVVIDAIMAKRNLGTSKKLAPLTIALGPGFEAGVDVDIVIETMRGKTLGKIIKRGRALPNTGIPGIISGYDKERVIHALIAGTVIHEKEIGNCVCKGDVLGYIHSVNKVIPITTSIDGFIRGFIRDGHTVKKGMKIADVDPRIAQRDLCNKISDKAQAIAESVKSVIN